MTPTIALTSEMIAASAFKLLMTEPAFKVTTAIVRGVEYRVFENAPPSLAGIFEMGAAHGDKPFIYYEGETWTFARLWSEAGRFANALSGGLGVKRGDRVALAMRNYPEWCAGFMALISIGAVVVPLNAWWKTEELRYALKDCGAKLVIGDDKRLDLMAPLKDELGLRFIAVRCERDFAEHRYEDLIARANTDQMPRVAIDPEDDYAIYYTSGSTGNPKGVLLTHRGGISTLLSWSLIFTSITDANGGKPLHGDNPGVLLGIPLFHVTGSHAIFLMSWIIGRRMAVMYRWTHRSPSISLTGMRSPISSAYRANPMS